MDREEKVVAVITTNMHMDANSLQHLLHVNYGIIVPVDAIKNKLAALRAEEHTKRCALHVTSASGKTIALSDLDAVIQYAIKGGMPPAFVK